MAEFAITRVDLDRSSTDADHALAREVFAVESVGVQGRYGFDVAQLIVITGTVVGGAMGSALWDFAKEAMARLNNYLDRRQVADNRPVTAIFTAESAGLVWEIRHSPEKPLSDFEAGRVIAGVDTWKLPEDAARVSINLIERRIAVFDNEGLHVSDLEWPS